MSALGIIGGSLASGLLGKSASDKARKSSDRAAAASLAEQKRQFDLGRNDLAPYRDAGTNALGAYQSALGFSPTSTMSSPMSQSSWAAANQPTGAQQQQPGTALGNYDTLKKDKGILRDIIEILGNR